MPTPDSYEKQISNLNQELEQLRKQLQNQQLQTQTYQNSMDSAQRQSSRLPDPRDLNPVLKEIRNKNLSSREKRDILFPDLYPAAPEDIYYQWVAPSKIVIKRDKQWYWTMGLLLMIMLTVAVIFREMIWVAVVLAFFFAIYVNASIPATETVYKLTRQGIEVGEGDGLEIYAWEQLLDYSYYYKSNNEILYIDTIIGMPPTIPMLFSQEDRKNIEMILEAHLPYKPVPVKQNWFSRLIEGMYIPLHDFKALQQKIDEYYDAKYAEILQNLKKEGRVPTTMTVEDVRNAESMQTMKLVDEMRKTAEEDDIKRILGLQ
jgi:hypothetical protein